MNREQICEKIMAIISEVTDIPVDEMTPQSGMMRDLDMSSLEIMTAMAEVEKEFQIVIPTRTIRGFIRIEDIADYIQNAQA